MGTYTRKVIYGHIYEKRYLWTHTRKGIYGHMFKEAFIESALLRTFLEREGLNISCSDI